jgi:hypothetical protein
MTRRSRVLAVSLDEHDPPLPFAARCVEEEIAEPHLHGRVNMDLRLLDERETAAPFDRRDHHGMS